MVQAAFSRRADIHAGAQSNRLKTFQNLNLIRAVVALNRLNLRGGLVEVNFYFVAVVILHRHHVGQIVFVAVKVGVVAEIVNRVNFFVVQNIYLHFCRD